MKINKKKHRTQARILYLRKIKLKNIIKLILNYIMFLLNLRAARNLQLSHQGLRMENIVDNMVEVRGAYKRYGPKAVILKGLNMTVGRGTIYAFLGPSGCGKTTLLKCILGRQRLDAGTIAIGIKKKSQVGYMPQEIALLGELSIKETIAYYGWMFRIKEDDLLKRKEELLTFLGIPPENRIVRDLSGGQMRRISLCVALLHKPDLLILDEPTVGVDPVLNHSIWQHLIELSSIQNKTIIITTHYIEEARQGNRIGMMRGGVLLEEGDPSKIMKDYGCETLEDVFLQLSQKQEIVDQGSDAEIIEKYPHPPVRPKLPLEDKRKFSFHHFISNFIKNVFYIKRSTVVWFLLFGNPILQCFLYEYTVAEPKGLKLGLFNEEVLSNPDGCKYFFNETCFPSSCKYILALQKRDVDIVMYNNVLDAKASAESNKVWGYLQISSNFTEALNDRLTLNKDISNETVDLSEIQVSLDSSNNYISGALKRALQMAFIDFLDLVHSECNWTVAHAKIPLNAKAIYGSMNPKFSDFGIVGVLLILEFFLPIAYSLATLKDKTDGVQERNLVSGMTNLEIIIGHCALTLLIFIVQTFLMMFIMFYIYAHPLDGNLFLALSLVFLVGVVGMCFGYVMAVTCDSDTTGLQFTLGTFIALSNLSGMFWPTEGMHYILRSIHLFLPLLPASEAFRGITVRSWTITHPVVYTGFLSVIGYIVILCVIISLVTLKKNRL